jgi:hypothetical protein
VSLRKPSLPENEARPADRKEAASRPLFCLTLHTFNARALFAIKRCACVPKDQAPAETLSRLDIRPAKGQSDIRACLHDY